MTASDWSRLIGASTVPVFIAVITILHIFEPPTLPSTLVFEPPLLLPVLNTLFIFVIGLVVVYVSVRSYLSSGLPALLLLGCGAFTLGTGALVAGWLIREPGGANVNVTIHNTASLFASAFHFTSPALTYRGVAAEEMPRRRGLTATLAYLGALIFIILLALASLQGATPPFFVQGAGPTLIRQVVLGAGVILFATSSVLFMGRYTEQKSMILYWYSLGLALFAVGLSAVFLQRAVGGPIGWVGRSAQFLGGTYFLISVLTAAGSEASP